MSDKPNLPDDFAGSFRVYDGGNAVSGPDLSLHAKINGVGFVPIAHFSRQDALDAVVYALNMVYGQQEVRTGIVDQQ